MTLDEARKQCEEAEAEHVKQIGPTGLAMALPAAILGVAGFVSCVWALYSLPRRR